MHFLGYIMLTKFQFHCSVTCSDILYFVFWLPYCHTLWRHQYLICIIQKSWISLERDEIWQKGKHHSSSLLKAFQILLFFNTSIFHFIGTLRSFLIFALRILSAHNLWCHLARSRARTYWKHGGFALKLSFASWKMGLAHQRARVPQLFFQSL